MNGSHANTLFVYGSLLSPEVVELVIGRRVATQPAVLKGYACYYVEGAMFPGIVAEAGTETEGGILNGLSDQEVAALDRYEDTFYQRVAVEVVQYGTELQTMSYVVPDEVRSVLSEQRWTWEEFQQLHLASYIQRMRGD